MSWKKRPSTIKTIKESTRIIFHIGMDGLYKEDRGEAGSVVDKPTRILTGDLNYT